MTPAILLVVASFMVLSGGYVWQIYADPADLGPRKVMVAGLIMALAGAVFVALVIVLTMFQ